LGVQRAGAGREKAGRLEKWLLGGATHGVKHARMLGESDAVALAGSLTPKACTDTEGIARPALDLVTSQVRPSLNRPAGTMSAMRTVRSTCELRRSLSYRRARLHELSFQTETMAFCFTMALWSSHLCNEVVQLPPKRRALPMTRHRQSVPTYCASSPLTTSRASWLGATCVAATHPDPMTGAIRLHRARP
jgi:hypothetical protein